MAINAFREIVRVSMPVDPSYADIAPQGYAGVFARITGDASGGDITMVVSGEPGFIYRLEVMRMQVGETTARDVNLSLVASGIVDPTISVTSDAATALQQTHHLEVGLTSTDTFRTYALETSEYLQARRLPFGDFRNRTIVVSLVTIRIPNTTTITYDYRMLFTYWPKDAMTKPGWWSMFMDAPLPR